jgi:DNA-binding NtrC family response regulator
MDDEPAIRQLASTVLTMQGYHVVTTCDGEEAIAAYVEQMKTGRSFQAVILDGQVCRGMGGIATVKALIDIDPDVRAIICSGYPATEEIEGCGFKASLPKPFTCKQLGTLVDQVVNLAA